MIKIEVYLENGNVYWYEVNSTDRARDHVHEIIQNGYRHTEENSDILEWFPPHRILKVKIHGGAESTKYRDNFRPT